MKTVGLDRHEHGVVDPTWQPSHEEDQEIRHPAPHEEKVEASEHARKEEVMDDVLSAQRREASEMVEMQRKGKVGRLPRAGGLHKGTERSSCDAKQIRKALYGDQHVHQEMECEPACLGIVEHAACARACRRVSWNIVVPELETLCSHAAADL